jgi:hypothetical protein
MVDWHETELKQQLQTNESQFWLPEAEEDQTK